MIIDGFADGFADGIKRFSEAPVFDPRVNTHSIRDAHGVVHHIVKYGDDVWMQFCVRMDEIDSVLRYPVTFNRLAVRGTYPTSALEETPRTCLRCVVGVDAWR